MTEATCVKANVEEIELIIEERVKKELLKSKDLKILEYQLNKVRIDRKGLIKRLEIVKKEVKDRHTKSLKLWEKAVETYAEMMKKQLGAKSLKFPEKPKLPDSYESIKGYIDMYSIFVEDIILMDKCELSDIFLDTKAGILKQKSAFYKLGAFTSGNALAYSDFSLAATK